MRLNNQTLILLAGAPGTGKTYTENIIKKCIPELTNVPLDRIKEHLYDEIGFDNPDEKRELDNIAYQRFYQVLGYLMAKEKMIIADYPFSYLQKNQLEKISHKYGYQVVTVRLEADLQRLYERATKRDLEGPRHLGLKMNHYHYGDLVPDQTGIDGLPSFSVFKARAIERGYQTFCVGQLISLDVNDYDKIEYETFLMNLRNAINVDLGETVDGN
ncbi:AAA family ATPase [Latilactobacillus fuchuensis]|uniref:UDP-N-acetylglucosamine kinase n=1 Tax=Latilactobacillus fuchuensis DSM 14340 = JCM 11249 TaxID=1423747 RepID=A0A0R1RYJ4_9LACO|nr:zeta toxin family protein [Latilactobacillus fuchuensis]KRL59109.1 kinase [Latilactobacillus fuchuensis DSM 14340 = JCM 11249]